MSNTFNYTPSALPVVNQVNNLADATEEAFVKIEDLVLNDTGNLHSSLSTTIGNLDNSYLNKYYETTFNYNQQLVFKYNSKEASLDLIPNTPNTVTISNLTTPSQIYTYKIPSELLLENDFTIINKKIIFNKEITDELTAQYDGYNLSNFLDNDELRFNLVQFKNSITQVVTNTFTATGSGPYSITGYNFKEFCSTHIKALINSNDLLLHKYVSIFSVTSNGLVKINLTSVDITTNSIIFETDDNLPTNTIKVFVANTSISSLIETMFRLFYNHEHDSVGQNIPHKSLTGLVSNTDRITYQNVDKLNYDHPQFLNREGYVNDGTIYYNGMLGDLLLSSIDLENNRGNNVADNSNKIVFGSYSAGHNLGFDILRDTLLLDSKEKNGLHIITDKNKKVLVLNEHIISDIKTVDDINFLELLLEESKAGSDTGILKIKRKSVDPITSVITSIDEGKIEVRYIDVGTLKVAEELKILETGKILFGSNDIFKIEQDDLTLNFDRGYALNVDNVNLPINISFNIDTNFKKLSAEEANIEDINITLDNKLNFGNNQVLNYSSTGQVTLKIDNSFNLNTNGRRKGLTLNNRSYIYSSIPNGSVSTNINDSTNLFIETISPNGAVYLLKNTQNTYEEGVSDLRTLEKADLVAGNYLGSKFKINRVDGQVRGLELSTTTEDFRIFSSPDASNIEKVFIESSNGLEIVSNYTPAGSTSANIVYGKISAGRFVAIGDKDTSEGFYGNVNVPVNHKLEVYGITNFYSLVEFNSILKSTTLFEANQVIAKSIEVENNLTVDKTIIANRIIIEDTNALSSRINKLDVNVLQVNGSISQNDSSATNVLNGALSVVGDVKLFRPLDMSNQKIVNLTNSVEPEADEAVAYALLKQELEAQEQVLKVYINEKIGEGLAGFMNKVHPVGTVYLNEINIQSPSEESLIGAGVWIRTLKGRSPMGLADNTFNGNPIWTTELGAIFGDYFHILSLEEMPKHDHANGAYGAFLSITGTSTIRGSATDNSGNNEPNLGRGEWNVSSGNNAPHNNVHPVTVISAWRRVG